MIEERHIQVAIAASVIIVTAVIGTVAYSAIEGWSLFDSLYFTIMTMFTVGYADAYPSPETRWFASFFLIFAVTVSITAIGLIGQATISYVQNLRMKGILRKEAGRFEKELGSVDWSRYSVSEEHRDDLKRRLAEAGERFVPGRSRKR